jgi:CHASE2 domain-containing sensor protein
MNFLDWLQITFSLVVALIGLYIAFARPSGRRVPATTRIGSVGVALLGLSYFVGGFEGPAVETPLFTRLEPLLAAVGLLVVLGAMFSQARGRSGGRGARESGRAQ